MFFYVLSAILVAGLGLAHLFAGRLYQASHLSRRNWRSLAGGVAVAYAFLHLLPDMTHYQRMIEENNGFLSGLIKHHIYLVALFGLAAFYGLEHAARTWRTHDRPEDDREPSETGFFWTHIASFAAYNALIGYLLLYQNESVSDMVLFCVAIAMHFVANDYGLRDHHKDDYDRYGRWILAASVFVGWAAAMIVDVHEVLLAVLFGFLVGGVMLNILKEELPAERDSRFWTFALGAGGYAAVLVLL